MRQHTLTSGEIQAFAGRPSRLPRAAAAGPVFCSVAYRCRAPLASDRWWKRQGARQQAAAVAAAAAAAGSPEGAPNEEEEARERRYVRALLLSFFASQNRSLFAAKCMVEVVVEMYREGVTLDDVKVALSLAGLQHGGKLLNPVDEDVLVSWVAVVMMALQMVGVPLLPQGVERQQRCERDLDTSSLGLGLQGMVRMAVDKFLAGTDVFHLTLQQNMAGQIEGDPEAMGESPAVRVLQQNTRLVIIALEVVRDLGLPTEVPLTQPPPPPTAAAAQQQGTQQQQQQRVPAALSPGYMLTCDPERLAQSSSKEVQQRAAGIRLLISFMGAATGWLYPAWDFVEQCCACYTKGWPAEEVYSRPDDDEFAQSGGMSYLRVARLPGNTNVTATVLARWISLTYMTLAQMRVPFPGALEQDGWAWVSGAAAWHDDSESPSSTGLEAYGLAEFVLHAIRNEELKEEERSQSSSGSNKDTLGSKGGSNEAQEPRAEGFLLRDTAGDMEQRWQEGFVTLEDPQLLATSPTTLVMSQQISLVQMARQVVLQGRARAAEVAPTSA